MFTNLHFWFCRVAVVSVAIMSVNLTVHANADEVDRAVEAINRKRVGIECVWYKVTGKLVFPAKAYADADDEDGGRDPSKRFPPNDEVKPFAAEILIDFADGRCQFQVDQWVPRFGFSYGPRIVEDSRFWVYEDGRLNCRFFSNTKEKAQRLLDERTFDGAQQKLDEPVLQMRILPYFIAHGHVPLQYGVSTSQVFDKQFNASKMTSLGTAIHNGHECLVLETERQPDFGHKRQLWFDLSQDYNIVRIDEYAKASDEVDYILEIDYERKGSNWIPAKCRLTDNGWSGYGGKRLLRYYEYSVDAFKINPNYAVLRRELGLEPGMFWDDPNEEFGYVIGPNLEFMPARGDEKAVRGGWFRWYYYLSLFVLAVVTFAIWYRTRRSESVTK